MIRSFVKNGRLMSLVIVLLIVSGLAALSTLPRTEDPRIQNRVASVITYMPGASAERIEVLISEKIEQKLRKLSEINLITSISRPGISVVQLKLQDEINAPEPVWSRVRDLVSDLAPKLPANIIPPVLETDRGYAYTQLIALNWQGTTEIDIASLGRYANELQNRLRTVGGTDLVSIFGQGEEEILVAIDQAQSSRLGLSSALISEKIRSADAKVSAGALVNLDNQMQVELTGALDTVERIRNIPLSNNESGSVLRLGDIASVNKSLAWPASEIALVNDQPSVVVATRMLPDLRIDKWTERVKEQVAIFAKELPHNIQLEVLFDQNTYTATRLGDLLTNISVGFILISLVLLVTLGWRSAMIVAVSLPLTVLFTLAVMNFYGLPIHQMSVTGLVVALGIMVDNAIVMTDTIQQKRQQGMRRLDSVGYAIKHLWLPLLGSSVTTILAFMPIVLMPGPAGEFVGGIALSVIFSLIGSYLISHTIVAGLAGRFISKGQSHHQSWYRAGIALPRLSNAFQTSLTWAIEHRKTTIITVFCLPLLGFVLAKQLSEQFFPPSDRDMFQIEVFLPAQSSIKHTEAVSQQVSQYLYRQQGIEKVRWFIGKNAPSFYYNMLPTKDGLQNYAQGMITASDFNYANALIPHIQTELDKLFPQAQILVRKLEQGPPFNAPVELRIFGPNLDTLKTIGDDIRQLMSSTQDVIHTRSTLQPGTPKVWVQADEEAVALAGLSLTNIAGQLNTTLAGNINGSVIEATESIPVRVRIDNGERRDISDLANIQLLSNKSEQPIPLTALAELTLKPSRGAIPHRDGVRVNVIEGYIRAGVLPSVVLARIQEKMARQQYQVPAGYYIEVGGESAERDEAVGKLLASVGVIFTLLITVVVLSFNSFRLSGIIFLSAFQSVGLGLLSIYVFDYPFGFTVIIGLLGLMGLAINAAIVIIAELKSDPDAVRGDTGAIVTAVLNCTRHISSTTITTVGGFLPLILAGGGFWPPFAVAVAGGTVLTTLLSFLFVPALFSLFSKKRAFETSEQLPAASTTS
ncbi:efflux RND transporter permease subunit [Thalassomonas haliotis]|uniref:Efflux RND transporter permease subunit n=1 Tax=Thalassomonas haliotis TaxID=485448 RepID=A0ABY7VCV3_9GAMM|nr:efflux RND transporter permease subunit [Thalassomonas haliotis]WDE11444.1 efflux RND transporter permease subunit [Thalassomonas haliotis]